MKDGVAHLGISFTIILAFGFFVGYLEGRQAGYIKHLKKQCEKGNPSLGAYRNCVKETTND